MCTAARRILFHVLPLVVFTTTGTAQTSSATTPRLEAGAQIAVAEFHTSNHNIIFSMRAPF